MTGETNRSLSVLVVTPKGVLGGAERWLLSVLDHTYRIEPQVVVLDGGPLVAEIASRNIPVTEVPTGTAPASMASAASRVGQIIRQTRPDVVLANGVKAGLVALPASKATGTALVWAKHDPTHEESLGRVVANGATSIIAVSESEALGTGRSDVVVINPPVVIPAGVIPRFRSEPSSEGNSRDDGNLRLAMVGRLVPNKGVDTAIHALTQAPDWDLLVVGATDPAFPNELSRLETLAETVGVAGRVTFMPETDSPWDVYAQSDAVAVLSRPGGAGLPSREGFGMVPIEAALAGLPVLADVRFVPSATTIESGVVDVDATASETVAQALVTLADENLRDGIARAGYAQTRKLLGPCEVAHRVVDVLADAAGRPGAGRVGGPPFSIVTTVLNEGPGTESLISGLLSQINDPDADPFDELDQLPDEIVVVDGGSSDDTWDRLQRLAMEHRALKVYREPGVGISEGRNIGVSKASHEWIACTDAGCRLEPGWLDAFKRAAATGEHDLLTGLYTVASPSDKSWQHAMTFVGYPDVAEVRHPTPFVEAYTSAFGLRFQAELPTGRSVAFSRATWEKAGGYPEDLATAEDVLFGVRAVEAGARATFVTDAVADWDQRDTLAATVKMYRGYGRGDGQSGSRLLVARDLVRAAAYVAGPVMIARGGSARTLAVLGAAAYMSLPVARAVRKRAGKRAPLSTVVLIPAMAALRDVSKAVGCFEGLSGAHLK